MRARKALALTAVLAAVAAPAATAAAASLPVPPPTRDVGSGSGGGPGARPAPALPSRAKATCGDGRSTAFPIGARIRGGPAVYRTGGDPQAWYLDLTNMTAGNCTAIHPVVVFTDQARLLRPAHLRMEFDAPGGPFHVSLERTDRDEIVAVFDGGSAFPGFSVGPGGTVTVKVRLAFAPDAPTGEVLADAALVQRKGDDGDWVGEAGAYRFSVEGLQEPSEAAGSLAHTGGHAGDRTGRSAAGYGIAALAATTAGAALLVAARRLRRQS
ncbi:hypothetical protein [Streptomyces sp. NPDC090022]|uniref:hypothetical protein n=1 Tax=Streptomyces sp. NPDC090022 TaxID=3365920 RepID=UPI00381AB395